MTFWVKIQALAQPASRPKLAMQCPCCKEERQKRHWFTTQWTASTAVVSHQSGDYDRCKVCYYADAYTAAPQQTWEVATQLVRVTLTMRSCLLQTDRLTKFVELRWSSGTIKKFDSFGVVECLLDSDPKQYKMQDRPRESQLREGLLVVVPAACSALW